MGIFFHVNELSAHQVAVMLDALKSSGATLMNNTQLVNYLLEHTPDAGTTYYADSSSGVPVDFRPGQTSPVVDQGAALDAEYKYDLMGIDQTLFGAGWEIGAQYSFRSSGDEPGRHPEDEFSGFQVYGLDPSCWKRSQEKVTLVNE